MISLSIADRHTSRLAALLTALLLAGGPARARPAPRRTVLDYYLLLPGRYFGGQGSDSRADRLWLVQHGPGSVVDTRNGYLHVDRYGTQGELTVCIFRQPDGRYLTAVSANEDASGGWRPFLAFYADQNGRLVNVTRGTLPPLPGQRLGYRLPHYGITIRVIDEAHQPVDELVWNGRRFHVRRGLARPVVPPITPSELTVKRLDERREYPSPDGRYVARLQHGDADVWSLTVTAAHSHRPLVTTDDVEDLLWVPGRGHRLVAAACAIYGKARLGLWEGGTHWRSLYPIRRPDFECFTLYGVTPDGRSLAYGHDPDLSVTRPGRPDPLERRHWLRLPR